MLRCLASTALVAITRPRATTAVTAARLVARTQVARHSSGIHYEPHEYPAPFLISRNKSGSEIINDPIFNKGTGFPISERDRLGLRGLVPPRQFTIEEQAKRILYRYHLFDSNLAKHSYLNSLHDRNETLFFHVLMNNIKEMAPIIYTPTVGEACIAYGREFRRARGMFFSCQDRGQMHSMVYNWPNEHVDVVVVTDGSRILGLGDLGCHGMGIPVGKLALYTAAGGIHPDRVLPVTIDVGTDNEALRQDPFYLGVCQPRVTGRPYFELVDEFMHAVTSRWPNVLVQFEDFNNKTAEPLLHKYRHKYLCFNDDIQGTGTVTLAGILSALRRKGLTFNDLCNQRIVCLGAGSAGLGVVNSLMYAMVDAGMKPERAAKNFWMVDADGLLGTERPTLYKSQRVFARADLPDGLSLLDVVKKVQPTILLGLSGAGRTFTEDIVREMAQHCAQPIIFPLSNPTSKAECSFEDAVNWTDGRVIFASGSPFQPVEYNGQVYTPSQGNNMYIFPGVGLGAVVCRAKHVTDRMMYQASRALASSVTQNELDHGLVFPDLSNIREVSKQIAIAVVQQAMAENLARRPHGELQDLEAMVTDAMYSPEYPPIIRKPDL